MTLKIYLFSMKVKELKQLIESTITSEVKKRITESTEEVYIIKNKKGEPVEMCDTQEEADQKLDSYQKGDKGQEFIIEKGPKLSFDDLDNMGEKFENMKQKQTVDEKLIGGQKKLDKNHNGELDKEDFEMMQANEEKECAECGGGAMLEVDDYALPESDEDAAGRMFGVSDDEGDDSNEHGGAEDITSLEDLKSFAKSAGGCRIFRKGSMTVILRNEDEQIEYFYDVLANDMSDANPELEYTHQEEFDASPDELGEDNGVCSECGKEVCECGTGMYESKKKVVRLTESEMIKFIANLVEDSIPGKRKAEDMRIKSGQINKAGNSASMKNVENSQKIQNSDDPKFPNQVNAKKEKEARVNSDEENEYVEDWRGGNPLHMEYDSEPSKQFKDRMKKSLEGHSTTGNSQDESKVANVIKSDLGANMAKAAERKIKKVKEMPMYIKDKQPTTTKEPVAESKDTVNQVISEEIRRMKEMAKYNKSTQ
jgi:hypothetical protein